MGNSHAESASGTCNYQTPRSNAAQKVQQLRSLPYDEALQLFHIIRSSEGPELSPGLSDHLPARNSLEFELFNIHAVAYPPLFPVQVGSLPLRELLRPTRLQIESPSNLNTLRSGPSPPRPLSDDRLRRIDINKWTDVNVPNQIAIDALSFYLEVDYPVLPMFDADLFSEDLINQRSNYCSHLLVSSLMCWAFLPFTAIDSKAAALSVALFDEAMSILPRELTEDSITTMAAIQILSITATTYAKDKFAVRLVQDGVKMGKQMGLFRCQASKELSMPAGCDEKSWMRAVSFTTWGTFNWVSLHCLHYQTVEVKTPTAIPMPGDLMDIANQENSEEVTSKFDCTVFEASCKLWAIFNDVLWKYYNERSPSLEFAESIYCQLLSWAQSLPLDLVRGKESGHAETIMHMYLHAIVADVFRPFLRPPHRSQRLRSFNSARAVPEAIYAASMNQLKRLLLTFRENFKSAAYSIFWQTSLIYVANAMFSEAKGGSPEWRFYLELCLAGMEDLYGSFRMSKAVVQSLLSMALREGIFSYDEARRVAAELEVLGRHHTAAIRGHSLYANEQDVEATYIFDLDLAMENHDAARAGNKAGKYEELMVLDEFTTGLAR
ncbi:hypothetical protein GGI43DRAFT_386147 [Trichoderma evansii]